MPRPSPASIRIVELLDFLADHPRESFRLSEIARRLGFNKATAHGMLAVLADAGYLAYDPASKTFSLGPTTVGLGQAAVADESKLAVIALPEMEALASTVGARCIANTISGDDFVVIATAGESPSAGPGSQLGYRGRMVPPIGMVFFAWASDVRVDAWLNRILAGPQDRARYRTLLAIVRERGYSVSAEQEARERFNLAIQQLRDETIDEDVQSKLIALIADIARGEHELMAIAPDQSYRTRQISAPIFDAQGAVRMGLLLTGLPELPGRQLLSYAEQTVQTARRITRLIAGSDVVPDPAGVGTGGALSARLTRDATGSPTTV